MQQYNLQWKGYPHHHLPRIRVASPSTIHSGKPHAAAQNVVRIPFGIALEKARNEQKLKTGRRRKQSYRGSSSLKSRRQTRRKVTRNSRTFGWNRSLAKLASSKVKGHDIPHLPVIAFESNTPSQSLLTLTDGTSCCIVRSQKLEPRDCSDSLMQDVDLTPDSIRFKATNGKYSQSLQGGNKQNQQLCGEHNHVAESSKVCTKSINHQAHVAGRARHYDPRLLIKHRGSRTKLIRSQHRPSMPSQHTITTSKRFVRGRKQSRGPQGGLNEFSSTADSVASGLSSTVLADLPSRSPSRQKALERFSRDLQKHLVAQQALSNASLATTSTKSLSSTHTIVDFIPYIDQFRASGLAVTSADQRKRPLSNGLPPRLSKDYSNTGRVRSPFMMTGTDFKSMVPHNSCSPVASSSRTAVKKASDTMDSPSISRMTRASAQSRKESAREVLPWLRKGDAPPPLSTSQKASPLLISASRKLVATGECAPHPTAREGKEETSKAPLPPHCSDDIRWSRLDYGSRSTWHIHDEQRANLDTSPLCQKFLIPEEMPALPPTRILPLLPRPCSLSLPSLSVSTTKSLLPSTRAYSTTCRTQKTKRSKHSSGSSSPDTLHPLQKNPSQNFSQLRDTFKSTSVHYDSKKPSVFEEALIEASKALRATGEHSMGANLAAGLDRASQSASVNADLVKNPPTVPHMPEHHRNPNSDKTASPPKSKSTTSWETLSSNPIAISDADVLKGIQVALAAACDAAVDARIEEVTGQSIRRMLTNLSLLDKLGVNELKDVARGTVMKTGHKYRSSVKANSNNPREKGVAGQKQRSKGRNHSLGFTPSYEEYDEVPKELEQRCNVK